jgi:hypothetical protein
MTTAQRSYELTGLYESELLVELMLRYWEHPFADNRDYRRELLESATEALLSCIAGARIHLKLNPDDTSLVAAIWYAESSSLQTNRPQSEAEARGRENWLHKIERCLPSCFSDPDDIV